MTHWYHYCLAECLVNCAKFSARGATPNIPNYLHSCTQEKWQESRALGNNFLMPCSPLCWKMPFCNIGWNLLHWIVKSKNRIHHSLCQDKTKCLRVCRRTCSLEEIEALCPFDRFCMFPCSLIILLQYDNLLLQISIQWLFWQQLCGANLTCLEYYCYCYCCG